MTVQAPIDGFPRFGKDAFPKRLNRGMTLLFALAFDKERGRVVYGAPGYPCFSIFWTALAFLLDAASAPRLVSISTSLPIIENVHGKKCRL
jgi:hypothetical protein